MLLFKTLGSCTILDMAFLSEHHGERLRERAQSLATGGDHAVGFSGISSMDSVIYVPTEKPSERTKRHEIHTRILDALRSIFGVTFPPADHLIQVGVHDRMTAALITFGDSWCMHLEEQYSTTSALALDGELVRVEVDPFPVGMNLDVHVDRLCAEPSPQLLVVEHGS